MSTADMMSFRTAYLRLVALAWSDPAFRNTLPRLTPDQIIQELAKLGHVWTWGGLDPRLQIDGPIWNPVETGGWAGNGESVITLHLPVDKGHVHGFPGTQAEALSDYYQQRPTLFGLPLSAAPPLLGQSYNASLGDFSAFLDFGGVTLRALALAWHNDAFKKLLLTDVIDALAAYFGYNCPWDLKLVVKEDTSARWAPGSSGSGWTSLTKNVLLLDLPQPPPDGDIRAIALTAYNETGPAYPFTCCD